MAHRLLQDPDADGWERSDFPIVCETCLGPNPYVRMQRIEFGGTCHISGRPYTVFRWRPGSEARYKKTIICQEVAKAKNVCQVCLFDLDYGLPVQVRDTALGIEKEEIPESDVGKEFQLNEQIQRGQTESAFGGGGQPSDMLMQLARTTPYYKRNQARICTFFVKGQCNRGAECPYRHEMPVQNELSEQNIKDRYYGINDPVANKMMRRMGEQPKLEPPEDQTITSLYVGGVTQEISEDDLRDAFYTYGELAGVRKVASRFCAFVTFTERAAAEKAAEALHNKLIIKGIRLRLMWGRGAQQQRSQQPHDPMMPVASGQGAAPGGSSGAAQPPLSTEAAAAAAQQNFFGLPDGPSYPSMDPGAQGSAMKRPGDPQQAASQDASKRLRGPTGYGPPPGAPPLGPPPGPMGQPPVMLMGAPGYRPPGMHMLPPGMPPPAGMYVRPGPFPVVPGHPGGYAAAPPAPPQGAPGPHAAVTSAAAPRPPSGPPPAAAASS